MLLKAAIVLLLPALALCQQTVDLRPYNATAAAMFLVSDINGDGVYDKSEIHQNFMSYDTNGDGRCSRHEYTSHVDSQTPQLHTFSHALYDIYDVDGDHFLDEHDFENYFNLMDGNGDGTVTSDEFIRWWVNILEQLEHTHLPPN